jgi:uncharacterized protein YdeI (YjbR/CyaY-like superfamily)
VKGPTTDNSVYCPNRAEWRAWLQANHATLSEIWLVFYKKSANKPTLTVDEAIDEGICFGWVDSMMKKLGDERYTLRFTPRKPTSNWSEVNRARVRRLIAEGRMTEAGLTKVTFALAGAGADG